MKNNVTCISGIFGVVLYLFCWRIRFTAHKENGSPFFLYWFCIRLSGWLYQIDAYFLFPHRLVCAFYFCWIFFKKNLTLCIWLKINSHLFAMQEQLDAAGVELPKLYKSIESQVPDVCETEAWKRRAHWAGTQVPEEANLSIKNADEYLQSCRPARR